MFFVRHDNRVQFVGSHDWTVNSITLDHPESELLLVIGDAEGNFVIASSILVSVIYIQLRYRNRARVLIFCISLAWDRELILGWYISLPFHTILLSF